MLLTILSGYVLPSGIILHNPACVFSPQGICDRPGGRKKATRKNFRYHSYATNAFPQLKKPIISVGMPFHNRENQ